MTSKGEITTLNFYTLFIKISQIYTHMPHFPHPDNIQLSTAPWQSLSLLSLHTRVSDCSHFCGIWLDRWPQRKIMLCWREKIVFVRRHGGKYSNHSNVRHGSPCLIILSVPLFADTPPSLKLQDVKRAVESSSLIQPHSLHALKYYLCHVHKILTFHKSSYSVLPLEHRLDSLSITHTYTL